MMKYSDQLDSGQTLVEVIVATAVVVLLITGLVVATTTSIRYTASNRARSVAAELNQQAIEKVRNEVTDLGYIDFYSTYADNEFCINDAQVNTLVEKGALPCQTVPVYADSLTLSFVRTVTATGSPDNDQMKIVSTVTWTDGGEDRSSVATTYINRY